jgi:vacuolar protein sorting-associated protein 41
VYLYSKTGQMKRALFLIIDRLKNVAKAIEFAKDQDDPDLWDDLLNYSMDKPSFIRGLLEQVGTTINPITLVRRIPEGLEIEGLRDGLKHIMKEHEIQYSISSGVARVLQSEVAAAQSELRNGQRRGLKFEVATTTSKTGNKSSASVPAVNGADSGKPSHDTSTNGQTAVVEPTTDIPKTGHCSKCHQEFTEFELETLVGFACGHVFHLTHLLELIHGNSAGVELDMGWDDRPSRGYLVGTKVTHARLLRDRIQGGCPVCKSQDASLHV